MALNEEQRTAFTQLFRDIDTHCELNPDASAYELAEAVYPMLWKWACEERIRRARRLGQELQNTKTHIADFSRAFLEALKKAEAALEPALTEPNSLHLGAPIPDVKERATENDEPDWPTDGFAIYRETMKNRARDIGTPELYITEPSPRFKLEGTITGRIPRDPNIQHLLGHIPEETITYTARVDEGVQVIDEDDEDNECEGHESLDGAHMGETVYCDGSCKR